MYLEGFCHCQRDLIVSNYLHLTRNQGISISSESKVELLNLSSIVMYLAAKRSCSVLNDSNDVELDGA